MAKVKIKPKAIVKMSEVKKVEFVTSGVPEIDELTGGYPRGRISQVYGLAGVGKTTLMMKCLAEISKTSKVLYCDVENAINLELVKKLGGDPAKIDYNNGSILEEVCELIRENIGNYDVIVLDSVAMLVPQAEHDGEIGEAHVGLKPRRLGQWLRMIEGDLGKTNTALILVNQMRRTMELYGEKFVLPGGMQLEFSCSLKLQLTTLSKDRIVEGGQRVGHWINVKVTKTKVSTPYAETKFKLIY